ncbi:hypothetical protein PR048_017625 [Dryococelus australis]|uniref:PiggyBac transposable element-derived protein domain-containing protein n=1 Tax=Dryococelus australis TaxID=614101 RepID=A0ABQ9HA41_9NEOP|nr:hypothetical protein PR048_017625 [Dryococelus australis]
MTAEISRADEVEMRWRWSGDGTQYLENTEITYWSVATFATFPTYEGARPCVSNTWLARVKIVPDDAVWSAGFLGDIPFRPTFNSGDVPHSPLSPSSALKASMLRAVQSSSLTHSLTHSLTRLASQFPRLEPNKATSGRSTSIAMFDVWILYYVPYSCCRMHCSLVAQCIMSAYSVLLGASVLKHGRPAAPTTSPIRDRMILVPNQDPVCSWFQCKSVAPTKFHDSGYPIRRSWFQRQELLPQNLCIAESGQQNRATKNDKSKWSVEDPTRNARAQAHNIRKLPELRGVQRNTNEVDPITAWNFIFSDDMVRAILKWTNIKLQNARTKYKNETRREFRYCYATEMKAFLELSNHENVNTIFATDGSGREIFRMKNKSQIPTQFLPARSREVGSSTHGFTNKMTLVSNVPKKGKAVIVISAVHHSKEDDQSLGKPEIITFYNSTQGGVDTSEGIWAHLNIVVLRANEGKVRCEWNSVGNKGRGTGDPRENPQTSGIVRHDSHLRKSGVNRLGIQSGSP